MLRFRSLGRASRGVSNGLSPAMRSYFVQELAVEMEKGDRESVAFGSGMPLLGVLRSRGGTGSRRGTGTHGAAAGSASAGAAVAHRAAAGAAAGAGALLVLFWFCRGL